MHWQTIDKRFDETAEIVPNLRDYDQSRAGFSWDRVRRELEGLPEGRGLNIAHEAVDRHAAGPRRDHRTLRCLGKKGEVRDYTYGQLRDLSNRFANVLKGLGIGKGDRVCPDRAHPRTLYRRPGHLKERLRVLSVILRLRP